MRAPEKFVCGYDRYCIIKETGGAPFEPTKRVREISLTRDIYVANIKEIKTVKTQSRTYTIDEAQYKQPACRNTEDFETAPLSLSESLNKRQTGYVAGKEVK